MHITSVTLTAAADHKFPTHSLGDGQKIVFNASKLPLKCDAMPVLPASVSLHTTMKSVIYDCLAVIIVVHRESKKGDTILLSISWLNIDRFS